MANPLIAVFNPITTLIDPTPSASSSSTPTSLQAFAPVVLNSNGIIDPSLVPNQGTVNNIEAGQPISSGQLVSLYYVSTQLTAELAWAGATGTAPSGGSYPIAAVGFAVTSANPPSFTTVQVSGLFTYFDNNAEFSASNIGDEVFLRWQTSGYGGITLTRPAPPNLQQTVGTVVGFTAPNVVQVAFVPTPNPPELNFSNISSGTNTSATMTLGSGASLTFSGSGVVNANELTGNPVSATTPTTGQALIWSGSAWAPSSTFSTSFTNLTTGTNTTAGMTVGSGSSLTFSGSGVININTLYGVTISATPPTTGQVLTATSASTADWETPSGGGGSPGGSPTQIQYNLAGAFAGINGSSVTPAGAVALAPTGTGVALTATGDSASSDLLDLVKNGGSTVFSVEYNGSTTISTTTGGATLTLQSTVSDGLILQCYAPSLGGGASVMQVDDTGSIYLGSGSASTLPGHATVLVIGDQNNNKMIAFYPQDGIINPPSDYIDNWGSVYISPISTATAPALLVNDDGSSVNDIAQFNHPAGGYSVVEIGQPLANPAMTVVGDATVATFVAYQHGGTGVSFSLDQNGLLSMAGGVDTASDNFPFIINNQTSIANTTGTVSPQCHGLYSSLEYTGSAMASGAVEMNNVIASIVESSSDAFDTLFGLEVTTTVGLGSTSTFTATPTSGVTGLSIIADYQGTGNTSLLAGEVIAISGFVQTVSVTDMYGLWIQSPFDTNNFTGTTNASVRIDDPNTGSFSNTYALLATGPVAVAGSSVAAGVALTVTGDAFSSDILDLIPFGGSTAFKVDKIGDVTSTVTNNITSPGFYGFLSGNWTLNNPGLSSVQADGLNFVHSYSGNGTTTTGCVVTNQIFSEIANDNGVLLFEGLNVRSLSLSEATKQNGLSVQADINTTTIPTLTGVDISSTNETGSPVTVTNRYGVHIQSPTGTFAGTTAAGLLIDDQTVSSTYTNIWAINYNNSFTVSGVGVVSIAPAATATTAALTVNDDGGAVNDIADFFDITGAYNVVAIAQPLSGNTAMTVVGDGTSSATLGVESYIASGSYSGPIGAAISYNLPGTGVITDGITNLLLEAVMNDGSVAGGFVNLEVYTEPGGTPGSVVDTVTGILARTQIGVDVTGVTEMISVDGQIYVAGSTVAETIGFYTQSQSDNSATITVAYGVYADVPNPTTGGVIGTAYGVYVADQTVGNLYPANYSIFVAGGPSVFAGVATGIVTKTTTYTATQGDHTINCNGTFTLTLPTTDIKVGQEFYIKNIGTGVITVSSSVNIDFSTSLALNTQGQSVTVQWDGTQWWIY